MSQPNMTKQNIAFALRTPFATRLATPFALVMTGLLAVACAGAPGDDDDDDDDDDTPCAPSIPAQECQAQAAVECRDQSLVALQMSPNAVTPGLIDNDGLDEGGFHSRVDATAGGFNGTGGYVYGKFTDEGLVKVNLTDDASFESLDWDISFRRFVVRLNSGVGGPGCVTAARGPPELDFVCPELDGDLLEFNAEQYMSPGTCDIIPDGSGLGSPGVVLQNFWDYPGCVQMTGNVYFISLADGRFVKTRITHYYNEASQQDCQETNTTDSAGSGNIQLDWAFVE
jgi:hypothetical protein